MMSVPRSGNRISRFGRRATTSRILALPLLLFGLTASAQTERVIDLTLDSAVDLAMDTSYRVRQLDLSIERTRNYLRSQRAALKSRVDLDLVSPEFEAVSDRKWNSDLRKDEIVYQNTRLWQTNLSIRQPVILFGRPTNGYLSFNNRTYRYSQLNGERDIKYYNRYFLQFEQPLFQPNELKNDIEDAELELQAAELSWQGDVFGILEDIADDYYQLFELAYKEGIHAEQVGHLEEALPGAIRLAEANPDRVIERSQIQVELANAREQVRGARSNYRLESSRLKHRLGLQQRDSLAVTPRIELVPIEVDPSQALFFGRTLTPDLRRLQNRLRQDELDLSSTKAWNSFRANLQLTYGRESDDPRLRYMWDEPTKSWSVALSAYVPIWDWGRRRYRVQAEEISLQKTRLSIEEQERELEADIDNALRNMREYQQRALDMQENLRMAHDISTQSLSLYAGGQISALELLQSFSRERETAINFLDTYLGYRRALLSLVRNTYYDFERDIPLLERFGIRPATGS